MSWANSARGTYTSTVNWTTQDVTEGGSVEVSRGLGYRFRADTDRTLVVNFLVDGTGTPDTFGLLGYNVILNQVPLSNNPFVDAMFGTSGELTAPLLAGKTYELFIATAANLFGSQENGLGTRTAAMRGTFNFSMEPVSPVPEPATLLLFGTAVAGIVGRYRRRSTKSDLQS